MNRRKLKDALSLTLGLLLLSPAAYLYLLSMCSAPYGIGTP